MGLINKKKIIALSLALLLVSIKQVHAGWLSPVEVITGSWGHSAGQFGI